MSTICTNTLLITLHKAFNIAEHFRLTHDNKKNRPQYTKTKEERKAIKRANDRIYLREWRNRNKDKLKIYRDTARQTYQNKDKINGNTQNQENP